MIFTREELQNQINWMRRGCIEKTVYRKEEWVIQVGRECMANRPNIPLHYYRCPFCTFFHLTKKSTENTKPVPREGIRKRAA